MHKLLICKHGLGNGGDGIVAAFKRATQYQLRRMLHFRHALQQETFPQGTRTSAHGLLRHWLGENLRKGQAMLRTRPQRKRCDELHIPAAAPFMFHYWRQASCHMLSRPGHAAIACGTAQNRQKPGAGGCRLLKTCFVMERVKWNARIVRSLLAGWFSSSPPGASTHVGSAISRTA